MDYNKGDNGIPSMKTASNGIVYGWALISVFSLVFAGLFALVIALARTPYVENFFPSGAEYLYIALVGHVVLAVVIWFLAFEGFLLAYAATVESGRRFWSVPLGWAALASSAIGMLLIAFCVFTGRGYAELANYVPVLIEPVFYAGLALFFSGVFIHFVNSGITIFAEFMEKKTLPATTVGITVAGIAAVTALLSFALSLYLQYSTGKAFIDFERLFWGGGHILQFANTIAMITAWFFISRFTAGKLPFNEKAAKRMFLAYLIFVVPSLMVYAFYDTSSQEYTDIYTQLMRWGIGPLSGAFMIGVAMFLFKEKGLPWRTPGFSSLALSLGVFLLGGLVALDIKGVNTKIPAHYHLAIGAVTIAFMGLFYEMLPFMGLRLRSLRLARIQPYLYSAGVVLFAVGLYVAGYFGVQRKVYAGEQHLKSLGEYIGMGIMGFGGLVAILGGLFFVINALTSLLKRGEDEAYR